MRGQQGGIGGAHHAVRAAARVLASQPVAFQRLAHKGLGGLKHLRLGAAEAVNALLGVAHDEHAEITPAPRARVGRQPAGQGLPLKRAGVLEFVDEQVAHARIQPLLHPAGQLVV